MRSAGYSGTPLVRKLGADRVDRVVASGAPPDFADLLGPLPDGVRLGTRLTGGAGLVIIFAERRASLVDRFERAKGLIGNDGGIWAAWPKKSSGRPTDLSDGVVREIGLDAGLVDNKVCAIDQTWSALRFVVRVRDR